MLSDILLNDSIIDMIKKHINESKNPKINPLNMKPI